MMVRREAQRGRDWRGVMTTERKKRKSKRQNARVKVTAGTKETCGRKIARAMKPALWGGEGEGWVRWVVSGARRAPNPSGWRWALTLESDSVRRHVYQQTAPPRSKRPLSSDPSSPGALCRQHEKQTVARLAATRKTDATPWIMAPTGSRRKKEWHTATIKPCSHTHAAVGGCIVTQAAHHYITTQADGSIRPSAATSLLDCSIRHRRDAGALLTRRGKSPAKATYQRTTPEFSSNTFSTL